jgi:hypothetical protein
MDLDPDRQKLLQWVSARASQDHFRNVIRYGCQATGPPLRDVLSEAELREIGRALRLFMGRKRLLDEAPKLASPPPRRRSIARRLSSPPGARLRALAEFTFSPKTYLEIFVPVLRDLFDEYCQELRTERPWKARWVRLRGYWSFWSAVVAQMPISIIKKACQIWKAIL